MTLTVITGGQSGVDEGAAAAVDAYLNLARPVGHPKTMVDWYCWLPKGFRRESPMPSFMRKEKNKRVGELLLSKEYDERTNHNIVLSSAVLLIEQPGKRTPGTKLTLGLAKRNHRQLWRFQNADNKAVHKAESHAIAYWLRQLTTWQEGGDVTLMVAGPRESKWTEGFDIAYRVTQFIVDAYERDIHVQPTRA